MGAEGVADILPLAVLVVVDGLGIDSCHMQTVAEQIFLGILAAFVRNFSNNMYIFVTCLNGGFIFPPCCLRFLCQGFDGQKMHKHHQGYQETADSQKLLLHFYLTPFCFSWWDTERCTALNLHRHSSVQTAFVRLSDGSRTLHLVMSAA